MNAPVPRFTVVGLSVFPMPNCPLRFRPKHASPSLRQLTGIGVSGNYGFGSNACQENTTAEDASGREEGWWQGTGSGKGIADRGTGMRSDCERDSDCGKQKGQRHGAVA